MNEGDDALSTEVLPYDARSNPIGGGSAELGPTTAGDPFFTGTLEYGCGTAQTAASAFINFTFRLSLAATAEDIALKSTFLLDDLAFDMASAVGAVASVTISSGFTPGQNYPNPFNPATTINFAIPIAEQVVLNIYDFLGQKIETLVDKNLPAGYHKVMFDASGLPSGNYFYKLRAGGRSSIKRMMLVK
jgi:hypothetical protein